MTPIYIRITGGDSVTLSLHLAFNAKQVGIAFGTTRVAVYTAGPRGVVECYR